MRKAPTREEERTPGAEENEHKGEGTGGKKVTGERATKRRERRQTRALWKQNTVTEGQTRSTKPG